MEQVTNTAASERERALELQRLAVEMIPTFGFDWNAHASLFLRRQTLSRILYFDSLYSQILDVPGVILEIGTQWGASLPLLMGLRGIYEPYNFTRDIVGFDTFEGLVGVAAQDGDLVTEGAFAVSEGHSATLQRILDTHSLDSPLPSLTKASAVAGDARETVPRWLEENPHAIVSMLILDTDLYLPTRDVLKCVIPRLTRGSLLVFDEANTAAFPGETLAIQEVLGLNRIRLRRTPLAPTCAYAVFEG